MSAATSADAVPRPAVKAIFADLDGTICHFPKWFEEHGSRIVSRDAAAKRAVVESPTGERRECRLLPSSTMGDGLVSLRTVELVEALRSEGVLFIVVTAARKSTLIERWPLLPPTDAAVCETGSRIYLDAGSRSEETIDAGWARGLEAVTGPLERSEPPEQRPEPLWQLYRRLQRVDGLKVDGRSYFGCFRVDTRGDAAVEEALLALLRRAAPEDVPEGVQWAMNLGKYDFFPAASGKGNAVRHLQRHFGLRPEECAALFDDDNDLPMAAACGTRMLPGLTSASVRRAALENPDWEVASLAGQGVFAVEELLEALLARVRAAKPAPVPIPA